MFKRIFLLSYISIFPLLSFAGELSDQINHDLNLPSGISVSPDNSVVYDSNYYSVKPIKGGHIFVGTGSTSDALITEENDGQIVRMATISKNDIQIATLGSDSFKSRTSCGVTANTVWFDAAHCVTLNKQLCQQILNSAKAKDANEAKSNIQKCKDLADIFDNKKFKDAVNTALATQKENFSSIENLVKKSNVSMPELWEGRLQKLTDVNASDFSKHFTDLWDMVHSCGNSKFADEGSASTTPVKYKPATAVK